MSLRGLTGLILAALLSGCASHLAPAPAGLELLPAEPTLWKLSLARGDRTLYSGLLLLNRGEAGGRLVLLDSTGIKLLEERVDGGGEVSGTKALRQIADRGLPAFLGRSIYRLFLTAPPERGETCRPQSPGELCLGLDSSGRLVKIRRWGPFVLWEGAYSINNGEPVRQALEASLGEGWFTPEVRLRRQFEAAE
jgi:hypothetical protein